MKKCPRRGPQDQHFRFEYMYGLEWRAMSQRLDCNQFVERLREAVAVLDDNVKKNLSTLLTKKTAKRRVKRRPASASETGSLDQDAAGTSAQEDDPAHAVTPVDPDDPPPVSAPGS